MEIEMISFKQVQQLYRARRSGVPFGDLAVMKFDMLSKPPLGLNERLRTLGSGYFDVDLKELRKLPVGTLGREYARMLDDRGLEPLEVTAETRAKFADNPYPLRYTTTHDLFHVLTGFPTTPAGEMGLLAFMIAQGFDVGSRAQMWGTMFLYSWIVPLHIVGMIRNMRVGSAMGKKAKNLLLEPLESCLSQPLDDLRARLELPNPADVGMVKGHSSLLFDWVQKASSPPPQRVTT
jgi:ubiquinone biosynthesis protein Coq4